ncbi:hypothetical protein GALMADRAFT_64512 [Galerina marginata CBS 339.88]|uniref:Uncharacterized protein n=1 Tax=Galerina marginata (strain CBS 339.88) TaxID=685588 RepID=A0A067T7A0_GALM3|nr:hypothetical protein GALMADRAFT_64512 [Galerina marginata CBS 339.88]
MTQHPTTRSRTKATFEEDVIPKQEDSRSYPQVEPGIEDTEWEDEEDLRIGWDRVPVPRQSSVGDGTSARATPRKRKNIVRGSRKQTPLPPSPKPVTPRQKTADPSVFARESLVNQTLKGASFTSRYALDVFGTAIHLLRKPLSVLLFLWLLAIIVGRISTTLRAAFAPLCVIPGISSSPMCRTWDTVSSPASGKRISQWADYPKLIDVQSKTFEQLIDDSVGGSALSLEIKKAEMATTDLIALVRISQLRARDSLASSLTDFVEDAKRTGRGLQKLTSKVGGAVDNIMAVNDYALQSIESTRANQPSPWSLSGLVLWKPPRQTINEVVTKTFEEAMDVLSSNMQRLIIEAENNLQNLNALEERLATLHEIISREDSSLSSAKTELLAELWTKLGGNRKTLRNFENHLTLLNGLGEYRKQALVHVVAALQALRAMSEDMEDMRERVAAPNLIGSNVPAEVHMKSIRMGLDRLREGRIRAKKLEDAAVRRVLSLNGSDGEGDEA